MADDNIKKEFDVQAIQTNHAIPVVHTVTSRKFYTRTMISVAFLALSAVLVSFGNFIFAIVATLAAFTIIVDVYHAKYNLQLLMHDKAMKTLMMKIMRDQPIFDQFARIIGYGINSHDIPSDVFTVIYLKYLQDEVAVTKKDKAFYAKLLKRAGYVGDDEKKDITNPTLTPRFHLFQDENGCAKITVETIFAYPADYEEPDYDDSDDNDLD